MMRVLAAVLSLMLAATAAAGVKTVVVTYTHDDTTLEGFLAWDDAVPGKRPGVLVVHQWMGVTDNERMRAEMLAKLGYVALAVDVYGKGVRPTSTQEAAALAGKYKGDRALLRARLMAGLEELQRHPLVDTSRTAAIGYCFGGTAVLELARSGANVAGVVSFHGALDTPSPADAKRIKGKVLVLHGADDPWVPWEQVLAFEKEMRDAGVDWQLVAYGGAVHAFTQREAGTDKSTGAAYNERADRRSWEAMRAFFAELFP
ncbi:MAG TPA: dienelactone hydrolase family protein [Thermoanaerobaculaceae bacterium]|nr:dienelactone hydrolase family protein [Thermoanaerobaculaceae bacterium]HRS15131.1 dienelactone hydrolase family protein [Thermoanaerobaculaceae bacterium]